MLVALIDLIFDAFILVFLVYIISSWIPDLRQHEFFQKLENFFDKILAPIRKVIPPLQIGSNGMAIDLSPIVLLIGISIIRSIIS